MKRILEVLRPYWGNDSNNKVLADVQWPPKENYYEWYALYAMLVQPVNMLEIGVAYGWSAMAMIAGWPAVNEVTLVDSEMYGIPLTDAEKKIRQCCDANGWRVPHLTLLKGDSRQVEIPRLPGGYDLIHVDGEHSKEAVVHDAQRALEVLSNRGVMVVDDVTGIPALGQAIDRWLETHTECYAITIPTYTGHRVIHRRGA